MAVHLAWLSTWLGRVEESQSLPLTTSSFPTSSAFCSWGFKNGGCSSHTLQGVRIQPHTNHTARMGRIKGGACIDTHLFQCFDSISFANVKTTPASSPVCSINMSFPLKTRPCADFHLRISHRRATWQQHTWKLFHIYFILVYHIVVWLVNKTLGSYSIHNLQCYTSCFTTFQTLPVTVLGDLRATSFSRLNQLKMTWARTSTWALGLEYGGNEDTSRKRLNNNTRYLSLPTSSCSVENCVLFWTR